MSLALMEINKSKKYTEKTNEYSVEVFTIEKEIEVLFHLAPNSNMTRIPLLTSS